MQIETALPTLVEWGLKGGNVGLLVVACFIGVKVNDRLKRDEDLKADYPPHRHSNGSITYPHDYRPTTTEHINGD